MGMEQTPQQSQGRQLPARLAGAVLLAVTAGIHLDLYLTGYRHIPTIGPLFLLQIIAAFVLAIAVLLVPGPLAAAAGAGFAISTLGGYLLTVWIGLFGFQEVRTTAGIVAGLVEIAAFAVLAYVTLASAPDTGPLAPLARLRSGLPGLPGLLGGAPGAVAALSVVALVVLGASLATATVAPSGSGPASAAAGSGPVVKILIKDFKFIPANPQVKPGEQMMVTNEDSVAHTITAGPSAQDNNLFTTRLLSQNQSQVIRAPSKAGMYPFYCTVHHFMTGTLIVGQ
jgi:plastocyanin